MTGAHTWSPAYGYDNVKDTGDPQTVYCTNNAFAVSFDGKFKSGGDASDKRLCDFRMGCRDFTPQLNVLRTHAGKLSCCMGKTDRKICGDYLPQGPGCESWMRSYCKSYPKDPACACLLSPVATSGKYNPICVDAKCISGGYLPQSMIQARGAGCPNITECNMILDMKNNYGLINFKDASLVQKCESASGSASGAPATPTIETPGSGPGTYIPPAPTLPKPTKKPPPAADNTTLFIMLGIILFVFLGVMLAVIVAYSGGAGPMDRHPDEAANLKSTHLQPEK